MKVIYALLAVAPLSGCGLIAYQEVRSKHEALVMELEFTAKELSSSAAELKSSNDVDKEVLAAAKFSIDEAVERLALFVEYAKAGDQKGTNDALELIVAHIKKCKEFEKSGAFKRTSLEAPILRLQEDVKALTEAVKLHRDWIDRQ